MKGIRKVVLVRHGQSTWNNENKFTGWTDVDLTELGEEVAAKAGKLLKKGGFSFDKAYTSYLKRAIKTLNIVLDEMDLDWIPVEKTWHLSEKSYAMLQGLDNAETAEKYGEEDILKFNIPTGIPYVFEFDKDLNVKKITSWVIQRKSKN